jgi:hypothetical protein
MEKMVLVSMTLFAIAATAFLVIFAVVYLVFTAKHIKGRVRGRGPFGLFAQPRHTRSPSTMTRAKVRG